MAPSNAKPVLIVGGGIGGLTAARNIMSAKTSEDYYRDLAWLYGGTGLAG